MLCHLNKFTSLHIFLQNNHKAYHHETHHLIYQTIFKDQISNYCLNNIIYHNHLKLYQYLKDNLYSKIKYNINLKSVILTLYTIKIIFQSKNNIFTIRLLNLISFNIYLNQSIINFFQTVITYCNIIIQLITKSIKQ